MTRKQTLKITLITGLLFLAVGGWMLHFRIHPPFKAAFNLVPFIAGITSAIIVPILFFFKRTAILAYLINGFLVILGTIMMAHFSLTHYVGPITFFGVLFNSLAADICILWGQFILGKAIFDLEFISTDKDEKPKGRYFRYPNTGWWMVHLVMWSIVYTLGNVLWK